MEHWTMMKRKGSKDALSQVIASVIGERDNQLVPDLQNVNFIAGKKLLTEFHPARITTFSFLCQN